MIWKIILSICGGGLAALLVTGLIRALAVITLLNWDQDAAMVTVSTAIMVDFFVTGIFLFRLEVLK